MYAENNPLRRARVTSGIPLTEVAARTALSPRIVHTIDTGRFAELPGGLYARSYIRAFATVVGIDPDEAVRDLSDRLPPAQDPLPALREIARSCDPPWLGELEQLGGLVKSWLTAPQVLPAATGRRLLAATVDAGVLLSILVVLVQLTALICQVAPAALLTWRGAALMPVWGLVTALYFVLLGGIGGRTPGAALSRLPLRADRAPLNLHALIERAFVYRPDHPPLDHALDHRG